MSELINKQPRSMKIFNIISWFVTGILVISMIGFTYSQIGLKQPTIVPLQPTATTSTQTSKVPVPAILANSGKIQAIFRKVSFKTNIPERPRYSVIDHKVVKGDSIFGIAAQYKIKPETLLWANYDVLNDNPDSLRIGMILKIPPTNGVYYQWKEGDSIDTVVSQFKAIRDDVINWPGNNVDLVDPEPKVGSFVMIPGGSRMFIQWVLPIEASGSSGTAAVTGGGCGSGPIGTGFVWPADNHYLSGNDYWSGHLAIDIAAGEGDPVYAADNGVVTKVASGYNSGYGNYIMIDHGNGYITLYAHLSQTNVSRCQSVYAGNIIGWAGNTGNSFGAHLHFELRTLDGGFYSPWDFLP
jgi:murein DD-endopeptidase MepM/ murein hydrolase activator NlpD